MNLDHLSASDGTGDAPLMHITATRSIGATTIAVDTVAKVPAKFIGTYGTLLPSGFIDPATKRDFLGHVSGSNLEIDSHEPGNADTGNTEGQVVVIKPSTGWANRVANFINSIDMTRFIPSGVFFPYGGTSAPTGFLLCDGSAVSRTTYAALFAAIGTAYGVGNGTTTFNLPNMKGRSVFGLDSSQTEFDALGETGGQKTMPAHTHVTVPSPQGWMPSGTGSLTINNAEGDKIMVTDNAAVGTGSTAPSFGTTGSTGTGSNNLNPYQVANFIIKI